MMSAKSSRFVDFMIFMLISLYTLSYFMPDHYGVFCTKDYAPLGPLVFCLYYMCWTFFTIYVIKNDPLIDVEHNSRASLWETTKKLSFHEYEGEYNHNTMVLAQR